MSDRKLSQNEHIKEASEYLRGTLAEGLRNAQIAVVGAPASDRQPRAAIRSTHRMRPRNRHPSRRMRLRQLLRIRHRHSDLFSVLSALHVGQEPGPTGARSRLSRHLVGAGAVGRGNARRMRHRDKRASRRTPYLM